jgi:GrpB-like predicted nucleotidyltransferase (UPF0157 family)
VNRTDGTVEVVDYDPAWPARFEAERALLVDAVPGLFLSVEHIGSTSVPGLAAKPTIDILGVVDGLDEVVRAVEPLAAAGYDYRPGAFPDGERHLFFRKVRSGKRLVHLHVLAASSHRVDEYRLFRDFLRANQPVAARYGEYKRALAARFSHDRQRYVDTKQGEVDVMLEEARSWRHG